MINGFTPYLYEPDILEIQKKKKTQVSKLKKLIGANVAIVNKKSGKQTRYVVRRYMHWIANSKLKIVLSVKSDDFKTLCTNKKVLEEANLETT